MTSKKHALYGPLLALSALFALGAALTLIPSQNASWENLLGYKSLCTFTPIATAVCALLAGLTCVIRARFFGPQAGYRKPWTIPIVIALALALAIAIFLPTYFNVKSRFLNDASSGATVSEP